MSEDSVDSVLLEKWTELKGQVELLEHDLNKSAKGVKAAGVRVRRGLRTIKSKSAEIAKYSVVRDKGTAPAKTATPVKAPPKKAPKK